MQVILRWRVHLNGFILYNDLKYLHLIRSHLWRFNLYNILYCMCFPYKEGRKGNSCSLTSSLQIRTDSWCCYSQLDVRFVCLNRAAPVTSRYCLLKQALHMQRLSIHEFMHAGFMWWKYQNYPLSCAHMFILTVLTRLANFDHVQPRNGSSFCCTQLIIQGILWHKPM